MTGRPARRRLTLVLSVPVDVRPDLDPETLLSSLTERIAAEYGDDAESVSVTIVGDEVTS